MFYHNNKQLNEQTHCNQTVILPNVGEHILRQSTLKEDVLDLDAVDEAILVIVSILEHVVELGLFCGRHHPRKGRGNASSLKSGEKMRI